MIMLHWTILVSRRVLENWAIVSVSSFNRFSFLDSLESEMVCAHGYEPGWDRTVISFPCLFWVLAWYSKMGVMFANLACLMVTYSIGYIPYQPSPYFAPDPKTDVTYIYVEARCSKNEQKRSTFGSQWPPKLHHGKMQEFDIRRGS